MPSTNIVLRAAWDTLCGESSPAVAEQYCNELLQAYAEPHRAYHNGQHLVQMLALLQDASVKGPAAYWATLYHDYVYRPGAGDNEAKSADIARRQLQAMAIAPAVIESVCALIMATKTHQLPADDIQGELFLDADMAILGVPLSQYQTYQQAVAQEFSAIPRFLFKRGRKKFLRHLLAQDRIYLSDWFYGRFEAQARLNMRWELEAS